MDLLFSRSIWQYCGDAIGLINRGLQELERRGFEKIHIIGVLLAGGLVVDSLLIWLLNWTWYILILGLLGIAGSSIYGKITGTMPLDSASEGIIHRLEDATSHTSPTLEDYVHIHHHAETPPEPSE